MTIAKRARQIRGIVLHLLRVLMFVAVIILIHLQHSRDADAPRLADLEIQYLQRFYPSAATVRWNDRSGESLAIFDEEGQPLGFVLQTSPQSDHLKGFSGPTNTLIAFDDRERIVGIDILSSEDTEDHVAYVLKDDSFLTGFDGLNWEEAARLGRLDGVSGATLTSLTILESIILRLSGNRTSLRFPGPLPVADAELLFRKAGIVEGNSTGNSLWRVKTIQGDHLGVILKTTPHADNVIGYQGPTESLIGLDLEDRVVGIALGNSYDNQTYVDYAREDKRLATFFNGLTLDELAAIDLVEREFEGVAGATMTSRAVAQGIVIAAGAHLASQASSTGLGRTGRYFSFSWTIRDLGTACLIAIGILIAFTHLRGKKSVRVGFQLLLIVYLGLVNGDMISQAMVVGWAQNGVPWRHAGGLILLTFTALMIPITTKRNVYCTHLCPHGAVQQLLKNRLPWRGRLSTRFIKLLKLIPYMLLAWCVVVAMLALTFNLVDIEPFDAWVFRVAGVPTIAIAIVGLTASLFVPMAYCRYGCPTGAMLDYLRFGGRSGQWVRRDWFALSLLVLALVLRFLS